MSNIKKHVCSLELSKKLNNLNLQIETEFYWYKVKEEFQPEHPYRYEEKVMHEAMEIYDEDGEYERICSAPLLSELLEIMPEMLCGIEIDDYYLDIYKNDKNKGKHTMLELTIKKDWAGYNAVNEWCPTIIQEKDKNHANTLAKLLIYLKKQKLI